MEQRQSVSVLLPYPLITQKKGEPLNKGHYGDKYFVPCRELSQRSNNTLSVLCREVLPISEGLLSEVPDVYSPCGSVAGYKTTWRSPRQVWR